MEIEYPTELLVSATTSIKPVTPDDSIVVRRGGIIERTISARSHSQLEQCENEILKTLTEAH